MSGMLHASADLTISLSLCLHLAPSLSLSLSLSYTDYTHEFDDAKPSPSLSPCLVPACLGLLRERERERA
jgi:hypothetical protein